MNKSAQCTAGATLKFSECQDPLLPVKWCHKQYRETLNYMTRWSYDRAYPNKTHEDEYCKTLRIFTSCEYLTHLVHECGAHYDTCHSRQEKREIMRMWMKQFVRGTHEIYWEFVFVLHHHVSFLYQ